MRKFFVLLTALTALAPLAQPASSQQRNWSVSLVFDGGALFPTRTMGNNAGELQQRPDEQVVAEVDDATTLGGSVEVTLARQQIRIRGLFHTTTGGGVTGRLAFCGDPDSPLVTGGVCTGVQAPATVRSFMSEVAFLRGSPNSRIRPNIMLGLGLRQYDIGALDCPFGANAQYATCALLDQLWDGSDGLTPVLRFGVGLDARLGPVELRTGLQNDFNRYPGGVGDATGSNQIDLSFSAGLAVLVF